jgi:hypothetical protein
MSAESRTLIVVLLLTGALASCCLCVPVVAVIAVPAITRVQMAAEEVRAKQEAEQRALQRSMRQPPPPRAPTPPIAPPAARPIVQDRPEVVLQPPVEIPDVSPPITELEPPESREPAAKVPSKRRRPPASKRTATGYAALSENQRRVIFRSAVVHDKIEASMKQQIAQQRQRGFNSGQLEQMLKDQQSRRAETLDRFREMHQLSEEEFRKIIAEGKEKGW